MVELSLPTTRNSISNNHQNSNSNPGQKSPGDHLAWSHNLIQQVRSLPEQIIQGQSLVDKEVSLTRKRVQRDKDMALNLTHLLPKD